MLYNYTKPKGLERYKLDKIDCAISQDKKPDKTRALKKLNVVLI